MKYTKDTIHKLNEALKEFMEGENHDSAQAWNDLKPVFYVTKATDEDGNIYFSAIGPNGPISDRKKSIEDAITCLSTLVIKPECVFNGDAGKFEELSDV